MVDKSQEDLYESLMVFDEIEVGPITLEKRRLVAPYRTRSKEGEQTTELIYTYDENVFDPQNESDWNLASMMAAQVAVNYGIFTRRLVFNGIFDSIDQRILRGWVENTAREIYVIKLLGENPFLTGPVRDLEPIKRKRYSQATLVFKTNPGLSGYSEKDAVRTEWKFWNSDNRRFCVLSSGGKDSLLSLGLLEELGYEVHPIFVNESGRHWYTALNAYRHFKETKPLTSKVWTNSDRLFPWFIRQMPFIRKDFAQLRADIYPIRLWTVPVFLFGVLPLLKKRQIGNLVIGDEYDTTMMTHYKGIPHYSGLYDQSRLFDDAMSRFFMKKGWNIAQFSILRPLSELLIETVLTQRYPELQEHQISCHATHIENEHARPCGKCEKCRRIVGMLLAVKADPTRCGYTPEQIQACLKALSQGHLHQEEAGAEHLMHLLCSQGILDKPKQIAMKAKPHKEVVHLRFDSDRSPLNSIPHELRKPLYEILLTYADGAVKRSNRQWKPFDVLHTEEINAPYPFRLGSPSTPQELKDKNHQPTVYLWGENTWPGIEDHLKMMDVALLPVGSIEQHGPHLPLDVDAFDADYLAKKVAEACGDPKPLVLPLIPFGVSYHHDDFKGTLSVTNQALATFVYDIGMSAARNGINKLVIINGHGDNSPTLNYAAQMINRDARIFVAVDTGETSDVDLEELCETENDVHAGEMETSTTLAIRPHLVKKDAIEKDVLSFESRYLNFSSLRNVPWYARTSLLSESGVMGDPSLASAEKGRKAWDIMIAHLVGLVEDLRNMDHTTILQKRY